MPWISRAGVMTTLKTSSRPSVILNASPLAAGFKASEISHSSNSTKTAESPILVEKTHDATFCAEGVLNLSRQFCAAVWKTLRLKIGSSSCPLFRSESLDKVGNNLR